ncbi:MAG: hypothetical protein ACK4NF_04730, partial [Planctomycetota bacterium]
MIKRVVNFLYSLRINIVALVVCGILLYGLFLSEEQNEQNVDITQFLENIKRRLQEIQDLQRRSSDKARSREEKEKRKKQVRKKLLEKLALPDVFQKHRYIIDIKKGIPQQSIATEQQLSVNKNISSSKIQISTFLKQNRGVILFQFPDFQQFLSKVDDRKDGEKDLKPYYTQALGEWFKDILRNIAKFWFIVWSNFQESEIGAQYLKNNECKNEKLYPESRDILNRPPLLSEIGIGQNNPVGLIISPLFKLKGNEEGAEEISMYYIYRYLIREKPVIPSVVIKKSLCYNLAILDMYGFTHLYELANNIQQCLIDLIKKMDNPVCKRMPEMVKKFNQKVRKYYKMMTIIFEKKLLPILYSIYFTQLRREIDKYIEEGNANNVIVKLLFSVYLPYFDYIKKSIASFEKGINNVVRDIYVGDGCIIKKELLKTIQARLQGDFQNYLQQLEKVEKFPAGMNLQSLLEFTSKVEKTIQEIKKEFYMQIPKENNECSIYILYIWNNIVRSNMAVKNILEFSVDEIWTNEKKESFKKSKISLAPYNLQKIFTSFRDKIKSLENKNDEREVFNIISQTEVTLFKIYENLMALKVIYHILKKEGCNKIDEVLSELNIDKKFKDFILCILNEKDDEGKDREIDECFKDIPIKKQLGKINFAKLGPSQIMFDIKFNLLFSTFSTSKIAEFIKRLIGWYGDIKGFYIEYSKTCNNFLTDENLQYLCSTMSVNIGKDWEGEFGICNSIKMVFNGIDNFSSIAPQCFRQCIQKPFELCYYEYTSSAGFCENNVEKCLYVSDKLLPGICSSNISEVEGINSIPQCCKMLEDDLKEVCDKFAQKVAPDLIT